MAVAEAPANASSAPNTASASRGVTRPLTSGTPRGAFHLRVELAVGGVQRLDVWALAHAP